MLAKFACANLSEKHSDVKLLSSCVVIYSSWLWSVIFFSISLIFVWWSFFFTKLLQFDILFSTAVRAVAIAKIVILGILLFCHW